MIIQPLLLLALVAAFLFSMRARSNALSTLVKRAGLLVVLALGGVAVLLPNLLTDVAQTVGVGRGADLLLYLLCVVCLFLALSIYRRFHILEQRFVLLTREIALMNVAQPDPPDTSVTDTE